MLLNLSPEQQPGIATQEPASKMTCIDSEKVSQIQPMDIIPGRFARRARRQLSTQTSWPQDAAVGPIGPQLDRLNSLIDRLENKVPFLMCVLLQP
jgi:hypothetical protein